MKIKLYGIYTDPKGNLWQAIDNLYFGKWMFKRLDKCITFEGNNKSVEKFLTFLRMAEPHEKIVMCFTEQ